jgi:hypothetical protein
VANRSDDQRPTPIADGDRPGSHRTPRTPDPAEAARQAGRLIARRDVLRVQVRAEQDLRTGQGGFRVTDFAPALTIPARGSIVEVKDVQRIYSTKQLRNLEKGARARTVRLEIFTDAPMPKRGKLRESIDEGWVFLSPIPKPEDDDDEH